MHIQGGIRMTDKIEQLKTQLADSQKVVFFGGAGVSTASGIPDFRSSKGLFMQDSGTHIPAEEIISHTVYKRHPEQFFNYYFEHLVFENAEPNEAHEFIKLLEDQGKEVSVVTQNIDGLHQKAGSSRVHELHGSVLTNYCTKCSMQYSLNELQLDEDGIPRCSKDGAIVRPDVVLYEEGLNQEVIQQAITDIQNADMLMIAGTSLVVYPAASLIHYFNGDYLVAINKTPIQVPQGTLVFEETISNVFSKLQ